MERIPGHILAPSRSVLRVNCLPCNVDQDALYRVKALAPFYDDFSAQDPLELKIHLMIQWRVSD